MFTFPNRYESEQPEHVPGIDWDNPITNALVFSGFNSVEEAYTGRSVNAVDGSVARLAIAASSAPLYANGIGRARRFTAGSSEYVEHDGIQLKGRPQVSVAGWLYWPAYAATGANWFCYGTSDVSTVPGFHCAPSSSVASSFGAQASQGTAAGSNFTGVTRPPAGWVHVGIRFTSKTAAPPEITLNGVNRASISGTNATIDFDFGNQSLRVARTQISSVYSTSAILGLHIWARHVRDTEFLRLMAEPFQMCRRVTSLRSATSIATASEHNFFLID